MFEDYLKTLYEGVSGFISYRPGEKEEHIKQHIFLTYGEMLYASVQYAMGHLKIDEEDVFCDLGSGIGKVVVQYFLNTPVKRAFGIEASTARHAYAVDRADHLKQQKPEMFSGRSLDFSCGNFLTADIQDATIIYTCSTCFDEILLKSIGELVDRCPHLKYFISMKPIACKLPLITSLDVTCSWDKSKCYVYGKI
jgi:hypothetical protein